MPYKNKIVAFSWEASKSKKYTVQILISNQNSSNQLEYPKWKDESCPSQFLMCWDQDREVTGAIVSR